MNPNVLDYCGIYLSSCASKHLPEPLRAVNELSSTNDNTAHWSTAALGNTDAGTVKAVKVFAGGDSLCSYTFQQPGSIKMHGDGGPAWGHTNPADVVRNFSGMFQWKDRATQGVFEGDNSGGREVDCDSISKVGLLLGRLFLQFPSSMILSFTSSRVK